MNHLVKPPPAVRRILVVDDTPTNVQIVSEILTRKLGCEVVVATQGQQALDEVRELEPDCILLDVMMPGMDGFEVARALKKDPETAEIPVLFLTAKVEATDLVEGFAAGAVDYITKPFNPAELIARVSTQLKIRRDREELLAREQFLRTVIESLPYPFAVINQADHRIEMANASFGGQDVIGLNCHAVPICQDPLIESKTDACPIKEIEKTGKPVSVKCRCLDSQGQMRHFEIHGYPVLNAAGQVVKMIESRFDVTQRVQNESRIRELEKAESLSRMAGAVAHHYNNMMSVVIGNLQLMQMDVPADSPMPHGIEDSLRAAKRAAEMGGLMLAYLGQTRAPQDRLEGAAVLRTVLQELEPDLPPTIALQTYFPEQPLMVLGNADQLHQGMRAIMTNAREAIGEDPGTISVRLDSVAAGDIPVTRRFPVTFEPAAVDYARFTISDTGEGIPEGKVDKVFDPFYSTKFPGRGLGLAVMLSTIKAHQGCVTLNSHVGKGTSMTVYVPLLGNASGRTSEGEGESGCGCQS